MLVVEDQIAAWSERGDDPGDPAVEGLEEAQHALAREDEIEASAPKLQG